MSYRQYAPTKFDGQPAAFKTIKERRALIGKRIGYDSRYSIFPQYGWVTDAYGRELEIDGSAVSVGSIEQVCVLDAQGSQ